MRDADWRGLDDEALERLLVERWLYRGMLLGVILLAAIVATYLGLHGIGDRADQITAAVLVAVAFAAAAGAFAMRQGDLKIHQELRRRRARAS